MSKKTVVIIVILAFLVGGYLAIRYYADSVAKQNVDTSIENISQHADVRYADVDVDLISRDVRISDITVSQHGSNQELTIDEIVVTRADRESEMPRYVTMEIRGIGIDIEQFRDNARQLRDLGYQDRLKADFAIDYEYFPEVNELKLDNLSLGIDDMGSISMALHLGKIHIDPQQLMALLFMYPQIELVSAKVSYQDDSLVERALQAQAKNGLTVDDVREKLIQRLETQAQTQSAKSAANQIKKFLLKPGELLVSVTPEKPQSLGVLGRVSNLEELIKLLGLKLESR